MCTVSVCLHRWHAKRDVLTYRCMFSQTRRSSGAVGGMGRRVACKQEGLDIGVWGGCTACIQGWPGVRAWREGWASGACGLASERGTSVSEFRSRDLSFFVFCCLAIAPLILDPLPLPLGQLEGRLNVRTARLDKSHPAWSRHHRGHVQN